MFIHIGKGRTGTTFLQEEIYSKHSELNYIAKTSNNYPDWLIEWHYSDDLYFNQIKSFIKKELALEIDDSKINLISSEAFSITGNLYQQAKRIKEIVPDAKIILTLRDPIKALISFYKYNVSEDGFINSLENSIDIKRTPMAFYKRKPIYLPDFYYDEIINFYCDLFDSKNVCVLKYEDMVSNSEVFFKRLSTFIGLNIDIDVIKEKLRSKVNGSPIDDDINQLRVKNLYSTIQNEFSKSIVDIEHIAVDNNLILSDDLKLKLIDNLKGKCFGYY